MFTQPITLNGLELRSACSNNGQHLSAKSVRIEVEGRRNSFVAMIRFVVTTNIRMGRGCGLLAEENNKWRLALSTPNTLAV